jgi:hypothetical protein
MFKSFLRRYFFPLPHALSAKIQSFTYYVPSPPPRQSGYREKQFDKVFTSIINLGFRIQSFKMIPNPHPNHSGFWVLFILECLTPEAEKIDLNKYCLEGDDLIDLKNDHQEVALEIELHAK